MTLQCSWMWQASQPSGQFSSWSGVCGEAGTGVVVWLLHLGRMEFQVAGEPKAMESLQWEAEGSVYPFFSL